MNPARCLAFVLLALGACRRTEADAHRTAAPPRAVTPACRFVGPPRCAACVAASCGDAVTACCANARCSVALAALGTCLTAMARSESGLVACWDNFQVAGGLDATPSLRQCETDRQCPGCEVP